MGDPQSCAPMDLSSCEQTNAARRESRNALRSLEESGRQLSVSKSRPYEYRTQVPQPQVSQAERSAALSERSSAKIPFRDFAASRWHGSGQLFKRQNCESASDRLGGRRINQPRRVGVRQRTQGGAIGKRLHHRADRVRASDSNDRLEQRREISHLWGSLRRSEIHVSKPRTSRPPRVPAG